MDISLGIENNEDIESIGGSMTGMVRGKGERLFMNGNNVMVPVQSIPDASFVPAVRLKNICKAKILGKNHPSYKRGTPDIMVVDSSGRRARISRQDFVKNFRFINGQEIKVWKLRYNIDYWVYESRSEKFFVCKMPDNFYGLQGRTRISSKYYIVAKNNNGMIDRSSITFISSDSFHKSYVIEENALIKKHRGKKGARGKNGQSRVLDLEAFKQRLKERKARENDYIDLEETQSVFGQEPVKKPVRPSVAQRKQENLPKPQLNMEQQRVAPNEHPERRKLMPKWNANEPIANVDIERHPEEAQKPVEKKPVQTKPYRVIARIVNDNDKLVGFVMTSTNGSMNKLPLKIVYQLCEQGMVANLELVNNASTGKRFLRGNGISILELPKTRLN